MAVTGTRPILPVRQPETATWAAVVARPRDFAATRPTEGTRRPEVHAMPMPAASVSSAPRVCSGASQTPPTPSSGPASISSRPSPRLNNRERRIDQPKNSQPML